MLWNDKRTPKGHVTDTHTGHTGPIQSHSDWGPKPPSGPGTWGHPASLPPVDHSRLHANLDAQQKRQSAGNDARARAGAVHQSDWNTPGVKKALRRS